MQTIRSVGRSPGWQIAFGVSAIAFGLLILIWPGASLVAMAFLLGLQLLVAGVFRIVTAFGSDGGVLYLLLGLLLVIAGILCLRSPSQTIAVLVLLFGLSWIVNGVIELFGAFSGAGGWAAFSGIISIVAGIVVLAYPVGSTVTLVWITGIMLIAIGVAVVVGVLMARRPATSRAAVT